MFTILRNNKPFGPYDIGVLQAYVQDGKILLSDSAEDVHTKSKTTVREIFKQQNIRVTIKNNGSVLNQIKSVGGELIIPSWKVITTDLFADKRLIYLATIGLAPAFLIRFTFSSHITFYAIALYFSVIWAGFFFYLFKTPQVESKKTVIIFFLTQLFAEILVNLQAFPPFSFFYNITESSSILFQFFGYILGVGVLEEAIKALPLFVIITRSKEPIIPQTLVYYGLISGIGFGVLEGVQYQTEVNKTLGYNEAFFMNIARLTSLPFLHAIWCGIAGYFISFGTLFPLNRRGLYIMAILIPAILHGCYDVFGWSLIGLAITIFSVLLLIFYLKQASNYQTKLLNK
jgi:RsiW-degrading membrane proteinase PrsW (M82 family)